MMVPRSVCIPLLAALVSLPRPWIGASAAEPDARSVREALPVDRGLVIHAGAEGVALAASLARETPLVVHVLLRDKTREVAARTALVEAGVHGQATVALWRETNRLPFPDNLAAAVVAELDALRDLDAGECMRAVRPGGVTYLRQAGEWSAKTKERPEDIDDWPQYFHDGAASDVSTDMRVGPARGLQWQAGQEEVSKDGLRLINGIWVAFENDHRRYATGESGTRRLIARDAYSGLPLWTRGDLLSQQVDSFQGGRPVQAAYHHPRR